MSAILVSELVLDSAKLSGPFRGHAHRLGGKGLLTVTIKVEAGKKQRYEVIYIKSNKKC